MDTPVLATKLFAPPLRPGLVFRQRLIDQLNAGGQRNLVLVSAPAGYGKTTLISTWLHETNIASAWLSLDEDDNDPVRFLQCFITALQGVIPAIGADFLIMLQGAQPVPFDVLLNLLLNKISQHTIPFILVLDDFHILRSQPVLDMVAFLLERMPPHMQIVLLSRTDPPFPLSRLRVLNKLLDIRAEQLRFTPDEIAVFLNEIMGLKLSVADLAAMETRTEGWIAGLQLAALSMQSSQDIHAFVTAFAGSHHYIMDYLVEEVLTVQSGRVRSFLLQTSILSRLCGSLCDAVVDADDREGIDAQEMLEALEQMNLFVIPLDEHRHWYRYHHLFADVLTRRLEHQYPLRLPELYRRASQWYARRGFIPEAIRHALLAGDQDRATDLIEQNGCLLLIRGEVGTLQKWIEVIAPYAQARPWISVFKAWLFALTGRPEQVEEMLQTAEKLMSSSEPPVEDRTMQGAIETCQAYQANLQGDTLAAARYARRALEYLPDVDLVSRSLRAVATSLLGDASSINGALEEARQAYLESARICQAAGDVHLTIVVNSNLANILVEQGFLQEAARIYSDTLQMTIRPDGQRSVLAGRLYVELAQLSYEWNDLQAAGHQVHESLALCREWGNIDLQTIDYLMLARLEHVQQHREEAQEAMRLAEQLANEHRLLPQHSVWVKSALARLWIAQEDLEKASQLVQQSGIRIDDREIPYLREPEYLVLVRLLLLGGDYDAALRLSARILHSAEAANRTGRIIEVLVLQSEILQGRKDIDRALTVLERALSLAQPQGYVRTFLDEGEPMAKLLHLAKSRRIETAYVTGLLAAMGPAAGPAQPATRLLIEPLSQRELEVLTLIEGGCSNQEIAARLVISIATVKRHISNIYAKLGVQTRTQAVSFGKELGLFR